MVAGKSFFFSKIGVQSCVRFRCTLLHSYFALHNNVGSGKKTVESVSDRFDGFLRYALTAYNSPNTSVTVSLNERNAE